MVLLLLLICILNFFYLFVQILVKLIYNRRRNQLRDFLLLELYFLQKMFRRCESEFNKQTLNQIMSSSISLIASVPDCSNLMASVFRLIGALVNSKSYREQALNSFLPILTAEAPSRVRSAATAQGKEISKLNDVFIVASFESAAAAETTAEAIRAIGKEIEVKIAKTAL